MTIRACRIGGNDLGLKSLKREGLSPRWYSESDIYLWKEPSNGKREVLLQCNERML